MITNFIFPSGWIDEPEDYSDVQSIVVPDDSLSIREIIQRYTTGVPLPDLGGDYQEDEDPSVITEFVDDPQVHRTMIEEVVSAAKQRAKEEVDEQNDKSEKSEGASLLDNKAPTDGE